MQCVFESDRPDRKWSRFKYDVTDVSAVQQENE